MSSDPQQPIQTALSEETIMSILLSGMIVLGVLCVLSCLIAMWSAWKRKEYRR